jgi:hypothetical protein
MNFDLVEKVNFDVLSKLYLKNWSSGKCLEFDLPSFSPTYPSNHKLCYSKQENNLYIIIEIHRKVKP